MLRVAYTFVITASFLLVAAVALQWHLVDALTPFLMFPAFAVLWLVFVVAVVIAVWLALRKRSRAALICFVVCVVSGLAAWFDPFTPLWLRVYFSWYEMERDRAVETLLTQGLPRASHNTSVARLPAGAPNISMGGNEVIVQEHDGLTYVLFFTFRGILDNYAGYLYVPDGGDPRRFMDLHEDTTEFVLMKPNWIYVSHH